VAVGAGVGRVDATVEGAVGAVEDGWIDAVGEQATTATALAAMRDARAIDLITRASLRGRFAAG
jgi:hypothetical protein